MSDLDFSAGPIFQQRPMIACFDVHYFDKHANAAAVLFRDWPDAVGIESVATRCEIAGEYTAGEFYKRELTPLLKLIGELTQPIDTFVIDAYCYLSENGSPGLGKYLHDNLPHGSAVIGVAKNRFRQPLMLLSYCEAEASVLCLSHLRALTTKMRRISWHPCMDNIASLRC